MVEKIHDIKFGTFSGVFVPSTLAIFGAVMYLILPKVLGGVGLLKMLLIIVIAHSISIATAFSMSSIATNINVRGGGLYYLISRSLGGEFGGGLGLQLFLAQTVAVTFYSIAFAKGIISILAMWGFSAIPEVWVAFVACLLFGVIAFEGAHFVVKLQYGILAVILLSLVSIFFAPSMNVDPLQITEATLPFWVAFAMFFPAVTGIDAGIGMSGDLDNPKKNLVRGTFLAITFTLLMYVWIAVKLFFASDLSVLFGTPLVMEKISVIPGIVLIGLLLATSSSALSYLMAAPRTLRALAKDKIFSSRTKFFAKSIGHSNEPRIALLVCLAIALSVLFMGGLDFVSQIVAIFFLSVYGWINGAAFFEKISSNPSFRPSFNSPTIISFLGMVGAYLVMWLFNPWVMVISILFQIAVFYLLTRSKTSIKLESVWDGVLFQLLRKTMLRIEKSEKSKKNWRPTIMAFCANDVNRPLMFSLLDWMGSNRGIMKFYFMMEGNVDVGTKQRQIVEEDMKRYIREDKLELFPRVIESKDFREALETAIQSETIGNLPLNTVLLDLDSRFEVDKLSKLTARLKKNVLILHNNTGFSEFRNVDVWWDEPGNGNLMMLLAYLITHAKQWKERDAVIRLFKVVRSEDEYQTYNKMLSEMIAESRIDNVILQIVFEPKKDVPSIVREHSHYSDLVLLGMPHVKKKGIPGNIVSEIKKYTEGLTTSLIVLANDKIDFRIN